MHFNCFLLQTKRQEFRPPFRLMMKQTPALWSYKYYKVNRPEASKAAGCGDSHTGFCVLSATENWPFCSLVGHLGSIRCSTFWTLNKSLKRVPYAKNPVKMDELQIKYRSVEIIIIYLHNLPNLCYIKPCQSPPECKNFSFHCKVVFA